jgi:hypothetical protein
MIEQKSFLLNFLFDYLIDQRISLEKPPYTEESLVRMSENTSYMCLWLQVWKDRMPAGYEQPD